MQDIITVNYLAVLVAAVENFIVGALWYGPLFGKAWMRALGKTPEEFEKMKREMIFGTFDVLHQGHIYFLKK